MVRRTLLPFFGGMVGVGDLSGDLQVLLLVGYFMRSWPANATGFTPFMSGC